MIGRQVDNSENAADARARIEASVDGHQRNGPFSLLLVQKTNANQRRSWAPIGHGINRLAERGEGHPLAGHGDVCERQVDIRHAPHGGEGERRVECIGLDVHAQHAVHVGGRLQLHCGVGPALCTAHYEEGIVRRRCPDGTPGHRNLLTVESIVALHRPFNVIPLVLPNQARAGRIVGGEQQPEYTPGEAHARRDIRDARPAHGTAGNEATHEHGQHRTAICARVGKNPETITISGWRPLGQMLVYAGKD